MYDRAMTIADYAAQPLPENTNPEWAWTPHPKATGTQWAPTSGTDRVPPPMPMQGPMPPATLRNRVTRGKNMKTDPTWDIAFTTKFPKNKPAEDQPLVTPKGAARVITEFLSRVEEITYLQSTQHLELATTMSEMLANGIDAQSLDASSDSDLATGNISATNVRTTAFAVQAGTELVPVPEHVRMLANMFGIEIGETMALPVYGDLVYIANMKRRIEWERFIWACGPVHRVHFTQMKDGSIGIAYKGNEKNTDTILELKRALKNAWMRVHDSLPSYEDIENAYAHLVHLGQPVLALMDDTQRDEYLASKMYGTEDPDPGRVVFHTDTDPKPLREQYSFGDCRNCTINGKKDSHRGCTILGWELYNEDITRWKERQTDRGYAGPSGILGLDEFVVTSSFERDEE